MTVEKTLKALLMTSVSAAGILTATSADAWRSPTKHRYLTAPLEICDKGTFYVGGNPKITPFAAGPPASDQPADHHQPDVRAVPDADEVEELARHHGARLGLLGLGVEGTAAGNEGWNDYLVRNNIPSYTVDQPGRGRSGFDHTPIHEAVYMLQQATSAGALALLPGGGTLPAFGFSHEGTAGFARWFGHYRAGGSGNADHDVTASKMLRHGEAGDPTCVDRAGALHIQGPPPDGRRFSLGVDQAIKSRTGTGAPSGVGTVTPDNAQVAANRSYLALDAYKFDLPNTENFLPAPSARPARQPPSTPPTRGRRRRWRSWSRGWVGPSLRPTRSREASATTWPGS